jgi:hypothetical protein
LLFKYLVYICKCNSMLYNIGIGTFGNSDVTVFLIINLRNKTLDCKMLKPNFNQATFFCFFSLVAYAERKEVR